MTHKIQVDNEIRNATPEEATIIDQRQADSLAYEASIQDKIAAKESAKAKLAALGLTEEEVNAIIGGV